MNEKLDFDVPLAIVTLEAFRLRKADWPSDLMVRARAVPAVRPNST
ncbi:MAG: hypothetical protein M9924_10745 [Rhizobiaceae bacterium]|nr:hypothetical protein [Rhizobiaceae bacterium]MCO5064876.1 hypothetical protein [Rhizobiaceae bacterium]